MMEVEPDSGGGSDADGRSESAHDPLQEGVAALMRDSILAAFRHFGGTQVVESILYVLELEHGVNPKGVARDSKPFKRALMLMFGGTADLIETRVVVELAKRLDVNYEGRTLEELLSMARISIGQTISRPNQRIATNE